MIWMLQYAEPRPRSCLSGKSSRRGAAGAWHYRSSPDTWQPTTKAYGPTLTGRLRPASLMSCSRPSMSNGYARRPRKTQGTSGGISTRLRTCTVTRCCWGPRSTASTPQRSSEPATTRRFQLAHSIQARVGPIQRVRNHHSQEPRPRLQARNRTKRH